MLSFFLGHLLQMTSTNFCSEDSEGELSNLSDSDAEREEDDEKRLLVAQRTRVSVRGDGWRSCKLPRPPVVLLPSRQP